MKNRFKTLFCYVGWFYMLLSTGLFAQQKKNTYWERQSYLQMQVGWQRMGVVELGWNHTWENKEYRGGDFIRLDFPGNSHKFSVLCSGGYGFAAQRGMVGLQAGYTYYHVNSFLLAGLQTGTFTDFEHWDWRLIPELGIHFGGLFSLNTVTACHYCPILFPT